MEDKIYDVVIVGAGISGSIAAWEFTRKGYTVLLLEAGNQSQKEFSYNSYLEMLDTFYTNPIKHPDSPYPDNPNAPAPSVLNVNPIKPGVPGTDGYFVQMGPLPYRSTYTRYTGGTTLHWLGTCLRMLPEDFKLKTNYGHGLDWPISYEELMPWYEKAEYEIGVSADVEDQAYLGVHFPEGYVYPMHRIPMSYLDTTMSKGLEGMTMTYGGKKYPVKVSSTPQGRNSIPNPKALTEDNEPYTPVGAVDMPELGQRCAGNSSCIPICPIQAKYNARKTLYKALKTGRLTLMTSTVACKVYTDTASGDVTGIFWKTYGSYPGDIVAQGVARGRKYVLTAHTIENAKLLLMSGLNSQTGLVGKNLMDHPVLPTWALAKDPMGAYRGPLSTSGIESLRGGDFRKDRSAFRIEIGNDGWVWPAYTPGSTVGNLTAQGIFGKALRDGLREQGTRELRFGILMEQPAEESNSISIDPAYVDALGNNRPVIRYDLSDYVRRGMKEAFNTSHEIYEKLGAEDRSTYNPNAAGYVIVDNKTKEGLVYFGAGHFCGTHIMGTDPSNSVVDRRQKMWGHNNLYLTGCGSMPSVGTSNPTLTMAALVFWAAHNVLEDLKNA